MIKDSRNYISHTDHLYEHCTFSLGDYTRSVLIPCNLKAPFRTHQQEIAYFLDTLEGSSTIN